MSGPLGRVGLAHHGWFGLGYESRMDTTKNLKTHIDLLENSSCSIGHATSFMVDFKIAILVFSGGISPIIDTFEDGKVTFDPL